MNFKPKKFPTRKGCILLCIHLNLLSVYLIGLPNKVDLNLSAPLGKFQKYY